MKQNKVKAISLPIYEDPIPHHRWNDIRDALTPNQWKTFEQWMQGQTCIEQGCYAWDFQRWVKQGMKSEQGKDWD